MQCHRNERKPLTKVVERHVGNQNGGMVMVVRHSLVVSMVVFGNSDVHRLL